MKLMDGKLSHNTFMLLQRNTVTNHPVFATCAPSSVRGDTNGHCLVYRSCWCCKRASHWKIPFLTVVGFRMRLMKPTAVFYCPFLLILGPAGRWTPRAHTKRRHQSKLQVTRCMSVKTSQFTWLSALCSAVCSAWHEREYHSSASLALCGWKPPVTGGLLSQRVSNAESVSMPWRLHDSSLVDRLFRCTEGPVMKKGTMKLYPVSLFSQKSASRRTMWNL